MMTTREIEDRVRGLAWPSPSEGLRERVLSAAALRAAEAPGKSNPGFDLRAAPMSEPRRLHTPVWRAAPVVLVIAMLVVIGACSGLDFWSENELDRTIARLEAKYGSLDLATLIVPAVPDSDNRALVVRAAAEHAVPMATNTVLAFFSQAPVPPVPAELRAFADANGAAIRLLSAVGTRRQSNWGADYQRGNTPDWFRNGDAIRNLANAIFVTSLMDIEAGRPDDAARAIGLGLGISASMRQEPDTVTQLVRHGVASVQLRSIRPLIASSPSAPVLEELARWLAENRTPDWMQLALLSEMKGTNAMFARMEKGDIDPGIISYIYPMTWPDWPSVFVKPAAQIGRPFVRTARLRYLRHMERLLDAQMGGRPRPVVPEPPAPQRWELVDRLVEKFTAGTWRMADAGDDWAGALAIAEIGVALRRFKLERSDYPADLSALVPNYLDHLPIDPFTGRPPVYARQGTGFTLQATGSNPGMRTWTALEWDVTK